MQKAQRKSSDFRGPVGEFAELQSARVGDEGLEESLETPSKQALSETGGAQSGAIRSDAILKELCDCWPHLPDHIRQTIMTLVRSVDSTIASPS
jgi:hypothetical protein